MTTCQLPLPPTQGVLIWKLLLLNTEVHSLEVPLCFSVRFFSEAFCFSGMHVFLILVGIVRFPSRGVKPGFNPTSSV